MLALAMSTTVVVTVIGKCASECIVIPIRAEVVLVAVP